ncbi:RNA-binding domain-containing protein [Coniophora puteana RWD-64-598 SS2]|uniref:RNA-binding domain-containing protein n=1 Tax=Coniophora puteana (strain RWD-64-598) TaxID=741705 RepID=A0A5M3MUH2_CONPW|nr:RNA-binding domain-containing protein [Coniophora puteana RWD-64-598 SS2]EIW82365.1 RNA-binding domain-containing protein [Coniophora puteana RWD-64-598 SS2]
MAVQPSPTLYINNLNDKVNKEELRIQLYALFTTHGKLIDVVASKGPKMRGQAFLVFSDLASATTAMRACEGMVFYDKPLRIAYAKEKSYATLRKEDPDFVPPNSLHAQNNPALAAKRQLEDGATDGERQRKREKAEDDDNDDGVEMEIDEDDDS